MAISEPFEIYGYTDFKLPDNVNKTNPILIGCFKSPEHLSGILNKQKSNIRLGDRRGSMEKDKELFDKTHSLILYNFEDSIEIQVFTISEPIEITGKQLNEMDYPEVKTDDFNMKSFQFIIPMKMPRISEKFWKQLLIIQDMFPVLHSF